MATVPQLRPLSIGEILDVGIKIYLRHWKPLLAAVLVVVGPVQAVAGFVDASATPDDTDPFTFAAQDTPRVIAAAAVVAVLGLLSQTVATGACYKAVADGYLGQRPDWRDSLRFVLTRLHSILWVSVLAFLLGGLALLALIVPGIWLFVSWTVAIPALLTEDVRGVAALKRSFRLVRGFWWRTLAILLLGGILGGIVSGGIGALLGALLVSAESDVAIFVVDFVGGTLGAAITTPLIAAFVIVLYVDLRVRKEAFDLQLLAERLGAPPGQTYAPPVAPAAAPPAAAGEQPPYWPPPPGWRPGAGREEE